MAAALPTSAWHPPSAPATQAPVVRLRPTLGAGDAGARGEVEADGSCAVERVHHLLVVELKVIGERQHAAGHDACGACRGGSDDHTHGGGALQDGHGAGHGIGLDGAH